MKRTRGLWVSIAFVVILAAGSAVGFVTGALSPTLGLDLRGGVAVILSAPAGTATDVMEQALENIRRRVDAFGVGEPDIFLSGVTIEVQIPGASDSTIEQRDADLSCVTGADDAVYGCSEVLEDVEAAAEGLEVISQPSEVCLVTGDGETFDCYPGRAEASAALAAITVEPEASPTPTVSPTTSPSASPSPSAGPAPPADSYCLTSSGSGQPLCFDTAAEANTAKDGLEAEVTERVWCLSPTFPEPEPTPDPSASPTPTPTASPSPTGIEAFQQLDFTDADRLPCDFTTEGDAEEALAAVGVTHVDTQFCVLSSVGEDLGCFRENEAALTRQRETGQQRLLDVIGTTARLEERPTLEIIPQQDPRFRGLELTCGTPEEQGTPRCTGSALDTEEVVYLDTTDPQNVTKIRLGPVVVTGDNIERAFAELGGGSGTVPITEWRVNFDFDGPGATSFGEATTRMFTLPPPQNQLAIVVDRQVVSNPTVNEPITGGTGTISGGFTEQSAKDLATLLNAGSLPVELTQESVRTVSPTLGEESLRQGVVAAIAGLILLFAYLLFYYRLLGVVAWFGMGIWALLALAIVSLANDVYALTLAGVAGLVISLGVTADSYIVFFERLKDELRSGKSARSVIQPAFKRALHTIIAADVVTGIAAAVLYLTAASSVRGFALALGVATGLDLFVVWFFKRPTVFLISRSRRLAEMRGFGLRAATAADHAASGEPGGAP